MISYIIVLTALLSVYSNAQFNNYTQVITDLPIASRILVYLLSINWFQTLTYHRQIKALSMLSAMSQLETPTMLQLSSCHAT